MGPDVMEPHFMGMLGRTSTIRWSYSKPDLFAGNKVKLQQIDRGGVRSKYLGGDQLMGQF